MTTDVVLLPAFLDPQSFTGKAVVVFDVLRATTTITTALAMGVHRQRRAGACLDLRVSLLDYPNC